MKTFGLKTLYLVIALLSCLLIFFILAPEESGFQIAFGIPASLMLGQLLYAPVIKLSNERLSVLTLFPFNKNLNVRLSSIKKLVVEVNHTVRFVVHLKDGTIVSTICNRYAYDMKPLYRALQDTNIEIETRGVGTIDWA